MNRLMLALGALVVFAMSPLGPAAAQGENPTILIMASDADTDGIPRKSRISTRVLEELTDQLDRRGFDVYDETAVTLRTHKQYRSNRTNAELIDIGRSIKRPPIDIVVYFRIFAQVDRKKYQNELRLRMVGRIISVHDGKNRGGWSGKLPEDRDQVWLLPNRCFKDGDGAPKRDCLLEIVGDDTVTLAQEIGDIVAEKLEGLHGTPVAGSGGSGGGGVAAPTGGMKRGFNLVFNGFGSRDYRDMEEYIVIFSGYVAHRPTRSEHKLHEVWYESTISTTKLQRNLHKMMEILEIPYVLKFSGNTYTIKSKNMRRDRGRAAPRVKYKW